ncbi:MAG: HEAT repeat domain-containing protein [Planctomycetota bacterium]|nr:HEAT repeat domain-containing protein [Planctomycetota bacterium]
MSLNFSQHFPIPALILSLFFGQGVGGQTDFQDAVDAYRTGDFSGAVEAFERVLADNPGNEEAYRMWESAEQRVMIEMLLERGELGKLAERFLEKTKLGRRELTSDADATRDVANRLFSGDELERQAAILELRATYGAWAVPALIGPLGDRSDINRRVHAIQALTHLGSEAVLPLMQVLHSEDALLRRNAAAVLGTLKDHRSAAPLAWLAQEDEDEIVRKIAQQSLEKIGVTVADPLVISRALATAYFTGREEVLSAYEDPTVLWEWLDGDLVGTPIYSGLYRYALAEQYVLQVLELGNSESIRSLLAAIHAGMKGEIVEASLLPEFEGNERLDVAKDRLGDLDVNLALAGKYRGEALELCLFGAGRNVPAAVALMGSMEEASKKERSVLSNSLMDHTPEVSFAAAMTLARLGELDSDVDVHVAGRLVKALSAVPDRLVMSIGDTGLSSDIPGWTLLSENNVAAGIFRAKMFPPKDVIVLQKGLEDVTLDAMVFTLREDPRTADVPRVVVADDVDWVESLYGDVVSAVVSQCTFDVVEEVAGDPTAVQARAFVRAIEAAAALSSMPSEVLASAVEGVTTALSSVSDDAVKVSVLEIIGRHGLVSALDVTETFFATSESSQVRVAAMSTAARLYAANGGQAGVGTELLVEAAGSEDLSLARAAAGALGQLSSVPEEVIPTTVR